MSPASDDESERQTPTRKRFLGLSFDFSKTKFLDRSSNTDERPPGDFTTLQSKLPLTRTLDRLSERSYCQDYQRLGLCTRVEVTLHTGGTLNKPLNRSGDGAFRLTVVNRSYAVCRRFGDRFFVRKCRKCKRYFSLKLSSCCRRTDKNKRR